MKVYEVILEWNDYERTDIETKIVKTKDKAIEIVKDYVLNDVSINELYEDCKENDEEHFWYDESIGDFYADDGKYNWAKIYILEKDIIE